MATDADSRGIILTNEYLAFNTDAGRKYQDAIDSHLSEVVRIAVSEGLNLREAESMAMSTLYCMFSEAVMRRACMMRLNEGKQNEV